MFGRVLSAEKMDKHIRKQIGLHRRFEALNAVGVPFQFPELPRNASETLLKQRAAKVAELIDNLADFMRKDRKNAIQSRK